MIKWHINSKERRGTMEKENPVLPKPLSKHEGKICLKEKQKLSRNYAALASTSRKHYKLVSEHDILIALLGAGHFLYTALSAWFYNINFFVSFEGPLLVVIPSAIIAALFLGLVPDMEIVENVDKAREFLLETGQEDTYENVNVIVGKYREGRAENGWKKIEDMLYEDRKVPAFENVRNILGDSVAGKLNETVKISYNLKERGNL